MIRCYVTDRHSLHGETLLECIARNLQQGVEWIQIREKDLSARELYALVQAAKALPNPHGTKWIVNTRIDVALTAGADGAHLPGGSPEPRRWRGLVPPDFLLGVSCHSVKEVESAQREGAAYLFLAPVFAPLSKPHTSTPLGLEGLTQAVRSTPLPVIALGGVTKGNTREVITAGAAGIAAISLYQSSRFAC